MTNNLDAIAINDWHWPSDDRMDRLGVPLGKPDRPNCRTSRVKSNAACNAQIPSRGGVPCNWLHLS